MLEEGRHFRVNNHLRKKGKSSYSSYSFCLCQTILYYSAVNFLIDWSVGSLVFYNDMALTVVLAVRQITRLY